MPLATIVSASTKMTDHLSGVLAGEYEIELDNQLRAPNGRASLLIIGEDILGVNTHDEIKQLVASYEGQGVPAILAWEDDCADYRELAISLGCSDYLSPPLYASIVNAKCKTYVSLANLKQRFSTKSAHSDQVCSKSGQCLDTRELLAVQDAAILCLATIARVRDHSTGNHILRTQHYVKALAEHLRKHPDYKHELNDETIELFYKTSALHDIGKVGIPDHILQKPGELTPEEYEIMKTHTILGFQAVSSAQQLMENESHHKALRFLKIAQQVTLSHHERWDGKGYPQGLKGTAIPLVARLMAVADVYDAMISRRPYKSALDHSRVTEVITSGRGTHFDPVVVDAFLDLQDMFDRISLKLEDVFPSSADLTLHSMADLISDNDLAIVSE